MDFATTTIDTLDRAKEYFQAMGCSSFHMSREYPDRYDEYRSLAISKEVEREWTCEEVAQATAKLNNRKTKPSDLWHIHSGMEALVQQLKTVDSVRQIYEATKTIVPRLPKRSKVLVAETVVGRSRIKYRFGLVFLAYDVNEEAVSRHLSAIATDLATSARDSGTEPERAQAALDTCAEIRRILGFN
jgi:hypothetical protein